MGNGNGYNGRYLAQDFIDAIPGSGGIISTIARRVGCAWHTAKKYCTERPTIIQAYRNEIEETKDVAESIIVGNIHYLAQRQRKKKEPVDSADAKWYLTRKAKERGYTERQEITGPDNEPLTIVFAGLKPGDV